MKCLFIIVSFVLEIVYEFSEGNLESLGKCTFGFLLLIAGSVLPSFSFRTPVLTIPLLVIFRIGF